MAPLPKTGASHAFSRLCPCCQSGRYAVAPTSYPGRQLLPSICDRVGAARPKGRAAGSPSKGVRDADEVSAPTGGVYTVGRAPCLCTRFGGTYTKIGTIQRRLAWPLRKDDTQNREAFHIFFPPPPHIAHLFGLFGGDPPRVGSATPQSQATPLSQGQMNASWSAH